MCARQPVGFDLHSDRGTRLLALLLAVRQRIMRRADALDPGERFPILASQPSCSNELASWARFSFAKSAAALLLLWAVRLEVRCTFLASGSLPPGG